ncbi:MAG: PP2C family protein-serine/threonine phosphatase [Vicinamibacterales bacterium]
MRKRASKRAREIYEMYARDLSQEDLQRLFTHDTRDAYKFFTRGVDQDQFAKLPWWKAFPERVRQIFVAFTMRLPPARRALYLASVIIALLGIIKLFRGVGSVEFPVGLPFVRVALAVPVWADGTFALIISFLLLNFLVLLEVADRLSLKGELEVAREIQLAMLPNGTYRSADIEICGVTRPANTVGGDFYDVLPMQDGRVIITLGDVAGKGSPAALLMALLLAVLRTLVDEELEATALMVRLNAQICRHSPASRFITLFYAVYSPFTGQLTYVNAGQNPPLLRRLDGHYQHLKGTGVALGMFEGSSYKSVETVLNPGDTLILYSDGITEAEDPAGIPFEEAGLEQTIATHASSSAAEIGTAVLKAVEQHAQDFRFSDDLTILILKRHSTL